MKAIVEAYGGSVHVESAEGLWTRFEIRLPVVGDPVIPMTDDVVMVEGDARDPVG